MWPDVQRCPRPWRSGSGMTVAVRRPGSAWNWAAACNTPTPRLGLTIEGAVRGLLAHEDSDYKEWGASGSLCFAPGPEGKACQ